MQCENCGAWVMGIRAYVKTLRVCQLCFLKLSLKLTQGSVRKIKRLRALEKQNRLIVVSQT